LNLINLIVVNKGIFAIEMREEIAAIFIRLAKYLKK
jgi:hypothetical protein